MAVIRLDTGSKGMNFSVVQPSEIISLAFGYLLSVRIVILSIGSRALMLWLEARAATAIIQLTSTPSIRKGSRTESWLAVRVPVLSEHRISTPARDSIAVSFWTMAFSWARYAA